MKLQTLTLSLAFACLFMGAAQGGVQAKSSVAKLTEVPWVEGGWLGKQTERFSMDRQVYEDGLENYNDTARSATWSLNNRCLTLTGTVGVNDANQGSGTFTISLDGQTVSTGVVSRGRAKKLSIDVEGAKSLNVELTHCTLANPRISLGDPALRQTVRMKEPEDGTVVSGAFQLRWASVDDAVSYGVEVVCVALEDEDEGAKRLRSYEVAQGRNELRLDAKELAPGRYRWSVVAFGRKKMLGSFASERFFTVSSK